MAARPVETEVSMKPTIHLSEGGVDAVHFGAEVGEVGFGGEVFVAGFESGEAFFGWWWSWSGVLCGVSRGG